MVKKCWNLVLKFVLKIKKLVLKISTKRVLKFEFMIVSDLVHKVLKNVLKTLNVKVLKFVLKFRI